MNATSCLAVSVLSWSWQAGYSLCKPFTSTRTWGWREWTFSTWAAAGPASQGREGSSRWQSVWPGSAAQRGVRSPTLPSVTCYGPFPVRTTESKAEESVGQSQFFAMAKPKWKKENAVPVWQVVFRWEFPWTASQEREKADSRSPLEGGALIHSLLHFTPDQRPGPGSGIFWSPEGRGWVASCEHPQMVPCFPGHGIKGADALCSVRAHLRGNRVNAQPWHRGRGEGFQSELTVFMQFWLNFKKSLYGGYSDMHMMSHWIRPNIGSWVRSYSFSLPNWNMSVTAKFTRHLNLEGSFRRTISGVLFKRRKIFSSLVADWGS